MKPILALAAILYSYPGFAGALSVNFIKDPNGGNASSGLYTHLGTGQLNWESFGATASEGTLVITGRVTSTGAEPFGGVQPANFRVDFTGTDFSTIAMQFQGILTSPAQLPAEDYLLQWSIHTVIFTGVPTYHGSNLVEIGPDQILSLSTYGTLVEPTDGKQILDGHDPDGPIPAGSFYGYSILSIERVDGTLDFTDPLVLQFGPVASDVPEPGTAWLVALAAALLALRRKLPSLAKCAACIVAALPLFAGSLTVTNVTTPNGGFTVSGTYSGYADAPVFSWSDFSVSSNDIAGTITAGGVLTCATAGGCGGGSPAQFRIDFTGSGFSTVDIDFQGTLTSLAALPDIQGVLYGTVRTVIEPDVDISAPFGFDAPTEGKTVLANAAAAGPIPAGSFTGYTLLTIEVLVGELDFRDPLINHFTSADVPEPATSLPLIGACLAMAALKRTHRLR
ncbi:MAG: PEP-CTERM sorting domain-containing protein [Bryobacteraceae bacterium]